MSRLQDELKEAIERKSESEAMEMAARQDSQEQAKIAKEVNQLAQRKINMEPLSWKHAMAAVVIMTVTYATWLRGMSRDVGNIDFELQG